MMGITLSSIGLRFRKIDIEFKENVISGVVEEDNELDETLPYSTEVETPLADNASTSVSVAPLPNLLTPFHIIPKHVKLYTLELRTQYTNGKTWPKQCNTLHDSNQKGSNTPFSAAIRELDND